MLIPLSGYLPDRKLSILYRKFPQLPDGCYFTWAELVTPEPIEQSLADEIAAFFAPKTIVQAEIKADIRAEIIVKYEEIAGQYLTPSVFKANAYRRKEKEAERWQAGERNPSKLKIMTATASELGVAVEVIAQRYIDAVDLYETVGAGLEAKYDLYMEQMEATTFATKQQVDDFLATVIF